jgi:hypothetical protein
VCLPRRHHRPELLLYRFAPGPASRAGSSARSSAPESGGALRVLDAPSSGSRPRPASAWSGGAPLTSQFVEAARLADVAPALLAAVAA